jgi:pyruvate formate lyase activating enzyme
LKGFTDEFYRTYCGGRLQPVLDTLHWIVHESPTWLEITNLIIPEANDSADEIRAMCQWIVAELSADVPLHFSAFHPDFQMTDRSATPASTLQMAANIAHEAGLRYVYIGNVIDPKHQQTYCPGCGRVVIGRVGYTIETFAIKSGRCVHCQTPIAGQFDDAAGNWGSRRMPIGINE